MQIETSRLSLRRPTEADTTVLSNLWRNEQVQQFVGGVLSQQDAKARFATVLQGWEKNSFGLWVVCQKGNDKPLGLCGLGRFETESESEIEIIYKFTPVFWGRGFATEAAAASLAYGFQTLQFDRIVGVTQEANRGSQRVLEKLAMRYVCDLWMWDAAQHFYVLTRAEWLSKG